MELVSVVIPTHFRPDRLKYAVESVLAQTWNNLEILVVSDGYDFDTSELMNKYSESDNRVKFISYKISQGGNHARNVGIENSNGKYIAFLDDDDVWYPTKIERQMSLLEKNPQLGLVGCAIQVINTRYNINYKSVFSQSGDLSKAILYDNCIGSTSCVLLRKDAIITCGTFDEEFPARQDHDLWIRICQKYEVGFLMTVELDYYVYDNVGKGQQVSKSLEKFIKSNDLLMKKYESLYNKLSNDDYRRLLSSRYCSIAQRAYEIHDHKAAREYAKKSLKHYINVKALFFAYCFWVPKKILIQLRSIISR